jgi:hypothetical protein
VRFTFCKKEEAITAAEEHLAMLDSRYAKEFVVVNLNQPQVPINAVTGKVERPGFVQSAARKR